LSAQPVREARMRWRRIGEGNFGDVALRHVAGGVYGATFPAGSTEGNTLEYYIEVVAAGGEIARYPVTAPQLNQTVVIAPRQDTVK
jgi:hypothetical protein